MASIDIKLKSSADTNSGSSLINIMVQIDQSLSKKIAQVTTDAIEKHGNGREWAGIADNKTTLKTSADFLKVERRLRIIFIQSAIELAVKELKNIMVRSIKQHASKERWINTPAIEVNVDLFLGRAGSKNVRPLHSSADVQNFKAGDVIVLVPNFGSQMYANASKFGKFGAQGMMAQASRAIKSELKLTQRKQFSPIWVRAERSRQAFSHLKPATYPNGKPMHITTPEGRGGELLDSAWTIAIRILERKDNG